MMDFDRSRVQWITSSGLVEHPFSVAAMERRVAAIRHQNAPELVWLLEHPPLYTAGTSARAADLKEPDRFPVFTTGRGGQYTYHGPGQRIAYVMLDVQRRFGSDVRAFVGALERWIIAALADLGIASEVHPDRVGVWVCPQDTTATERKIAAIGIRVRHGVSFHGVSLNVAPDLTHFDGIVPCGIADRGVTSLADLGCSASIKDVDMCLRQSFETTFGSGTDLVSPAAAGLIAREAVSK
ncbi:MAG: lipoyl(octanoyl) transferase LipB [Rhizobiales bacterium]|nr:lipoyl(octanoyl) transferase LipB [Hyphomicrobiales bacterium]